jgi:hypothetical protein
MTTRGFIYSRPFVYRSFMKILYGKEYLTRWEKVASQIEPGSSTLDVCCGDAGFSKFLDPSCHYRGIDINKSFEEEAHRSGIDFINMDIRVEEWPPADYVIMLGSLYQFIPNHQILINKGLDAARKTFIISEPIKNLASKSVFLSKLSSILINPGTDWSNKRFDRTSFLEVLEQNNCNEIIDNGRELIGVFKID